VRTTHLLKPQRFCDQLEIEYNTTRASAASEDLQQDVLTDHYNTRESYQGVLTDAS